MIKVGPTDCYYAQAPEPRVPTAEKRAIILLTDVFGLPLGNPKLLADGFAKEVGLDVYVPDMFAGTPPIDEKTIQPYDHSEVGVKPPLWKNLGYTWQVLWGVPSMLTTNSRANVTARMRTFIEALKKEKGLEKVGAVGYCFGGMIIAELAPYYLLSSAVICHPGGFKHNLVDEMDFPTSWITCEEDFTFPPTAAEAVESRLAARAKSAQEGGKPAPEYEFKKYMGTRHGFACRPALEVKDVREAFEKAGEQTVGWVRKTLL